MKKYWSRINILYNKSWKTLASKKMSQREINFINYYLDQSNPRRILDIGFGTGRVLDNLAKHSPRNALIYGIDFTKKLVTYCRQKFLENKQIKILNLCDISKEDINIDGKFDFITAIRVLQYNQNWQEIIKKVYKRLNNKGFFIFTIPNYNSINRFIGAKSRHSTVNELIRILNPIGFKIVEIRSMTKIPDFFYQCFFSNNELYSNALILFEQILELIFGKIFMGRILFVAVCKNVIKKK